jgi:integral membrane protein
MAEGLSFIALLGIAMPLKYMAGMPMAVRIVGSLHGFLFVVFCWVLLTTMRELRWSLLEAAGVFVAAVVPCGPFLIDGRLRRKESSAPAQISES